MIGMRRPPNFSRPPDIRAAMTAYPVIAGRGVNASRAACRDCRGIWSLFTLLSRYSGIRFAK